MKLLCTPASAAVKDSFSHGRGTNVRSLRSPTNEIVRANVRRLLADAGISQAEAASWLGVDPSAVTHKLAGRSQITLADLDILATWLDLPVVCLLIVDAHLLVVPAASPAMVGRRDRGV